MGYSTTTEQLLRLTESTEPTRARALGVAILGLREEHLAADILHWVQQNDPDEEVRLEAANRLAQLGFEEGVSTLQRACFTGTKNSFKWGNRLAALGDTSCVPALYEAIQKADPEIKASALLMAPFYFQHLEETDHENLLDLFAENLSSENRATRLRAMGAIQASGSRCRLHDDKILSLFEKAAATEEHDRNKKWAERLRQEWALRAAQSRKAHD